MAGDTGMVPGTPVGPGARVNVFEWTYELDTSGYTAKKGMTVKYSGILIRFGDYLWQQETGDITITQALVYNPVDRRLTWESPERLIFTGGE